jgi:DNA-binding NtrC family response regulator
MTGAVQFVVSLLIIEDDPVTTELLSLALAQPALSIITASGLEQGLQILARKRPQIVLADLALTRQGTGVLERIMQIDSGAIVILMARSLSVELAVEAIKNGASDCLDKSVSMETLRGRIGKVLKAVWKRQRYDHGEDDHCGRAGFEGIIGDSPQMAEMFSRIRRVAPHYRALLITGETGTGKDLLARACHELSPVSAGRFVVVNCSAVVETLFESELFGHVKGSFTGATQDKAGLFEYANGGTLFLDEVGDMPLSTQAKLLRVLQNQEVQRVGTLNSHKVDVRVIAATNHDLRVSMAEKRFRTDLYYRLSMVEIQTPRLAERKGDLPLLQSFFVARFAARYGKQIRGLTQRAQLRLSQHTWPGNVRELENVIGYAAMMTADDMIDVSDLKAYLQGPLAGDPSCLDEQERLLIARTLDSVNGNQTQAARILRISRDRLRYKIRKHKLDTPDSGRAAVVAG